MFNEGRTLLCRLGGKARSPSHPWTEGCGPACHPVLQMRPASDVFNFNARYNLPFEFIIEMFDIYASCWASSIWPANGWKTLSMHVCITPSVRPYGCKLIEVDYKQIIRRNVPPNHV